MAKPKMVTKKPKVKKEVKENKKIENKENVNNVKTNYKGYIWAICPQCHTDYIFLDNNGLYNDTIPEDVLCPECIRVNENLKRIQDFTTKYNIKNRSVIKLMKHIMFYDKNSAKKRINSVYKEAQKLYKLNKEEKRLTK